MKTFTHILIAILAVMLAIEPSVWARGGGGGGGGSRGGGGGGGSRGGGGGGGSRGGGGGGSMSRPSGGGSRPGGGGGGSMSRPSGGGSRPGGGGGGSMSRPSGGGSRPSGGGGFSGGVSRPSTPAARPSGGGTRPSTPATRPSGGGTRPSTPASRPGTGGSRPSAGQVNDFLGLPGDAGGGRPTTLPAQPGGGNRPGTGGRPSTLPAGGNKPGGVGGVGGPGKPGGVGGVGGPGRPGGIGGVGGPGQPGGIGGVGGPGRPGTRPARGNWQQNNNSRTIQNNFYGYGGYHGGYPYGASWYSMHPGAAWTMFGVTVGAFALSSFGTIGHFLDDDVVVVQDPTPYYYGSTIYYEGDTVYVNQQPAGTAEQYYDQASTLASAGAPEETAQTEDWLPLGVFAIAAADDTNATLTVQLAMNKQGVLRGNQFDMATGTNAIVKGSIDKKTQKVAWTAGDDTSVVYETGLANLTQEQSTVLIHYGKDDAEVYSLMHINEPVDDPSGS